MALTERTNIYLFARHQNTCERVYPGCHITCDQLQLAYPMEQLEAVNRDDEDNPDNWFSVCSNCSVSSVPGDLPIALG